MASCERQAWVHVNGKQHRHSSWWTFFFSEHSSLYIHGSSRKPTRKATRREPDSTHGGVRHFATSGNANCKVRQGNVQLPTEDRTHVPHSEASHSAR